MAMGYGDHNAYPAARPEPKRKHTSRGPSYLQFPYANLIFEFIVNQLFIDIHRETKPQLASKQRWSSPVERH